MGDVDTCGCHQTLEVKGGAVVKYGGIQENCGVQNAILWSWSLYNFQSDSWGTFRCVRDHDWTCQVYECGQRRMIDTLSQTCYLPTYAFLAIFTGTSHFTEAANDTPGQEEVKAYDGHDKTSKGSSQTKKNTESTLDPHTILCFCLKAQAVLETIGLGASLLDTEAFSDGRYGLWIGSYFQGRRQNDASDDNNGFTEVSGRNSYVGAGNGKFKKGCRSQEQEICWLRCLLTAPPGRLEPSP